MRYHAIEKALTQLREARERRMKQSHATEPAERASAEHSLTWAIDEVLKAAALPSDESIPLETMEVMEFCHRAGLGKPGSPNTLWAMVKEACERMVAAEAKLLSISDAEKMLTKMREFIAEKKPTMERISIVATLYKMRDDAWNAAGDAGMRDQADRQSVLIAEGNALNHAAQVIAESAMTPENTQ